jgi:hypothetical protein
MFPALSQCCARWEDESRLLISWQIEHPSKDGRDEHPAELHAIASSANISAMVRF